MPAAKPATSATSGARRTSGCGGDTATNRRTASTVASASRIQNTRPTTRLMPSLRREGHRHSTRRVRRRRPLRRVGGRRNLRREGHEVESSRGENGVLDEMPCLDQGEPVPAQSVLEARPPEDSRDDEDRSGGVDEPGIGNRGANLGPVDELRGAKAHAGTGCNGRRRRRGRPLPGRPRRARGDRARLPTGSAVGHGRARLRGPNTSSRALSPAPGA